MWPHLTKKEAERERGRGLALECDMGERKCGKKNTKIPKYV